MTTLSFEVEWRDLPDGAGAGTPLAWGDGVLSVLGTAVWCNGVAPSIKPIRWSWIELLEFLGNKWPSLVGEQQYPLGMTPKTPGSLRSDVESRWNPDDGLARQELEEDQELFRFEGRHDLARGMRGIDLPSVVIMREGEQAWVCTEYGENYVDLDALVGDLERIGDSIASHVDGCSDERVAAALRKWRAREQPDRKTLIRFATGLPSTLLASDTKYAALEYWELEAVSGSDSEIAAAARLLPGARLDVVEIEAILDQIRSVPSIPTPGLDALAVELAEALHDLNGADPFRLGEAGAVEVRKRLQLGDERVDPEQILRSLAIPILRMELTELIDAIGCWGPRHGPAVVLNTAGKRSKVAHGARATLAHELCHLLFDRNKALPMAEVLGGRVPYRPERRANAFAAELLFPRLRARQIYARKKTLDAALFAASEAFDVSRSLAAGQFLNADRGIPLGLTSTDEAKLRSIVNTDGWGYAEY